MIESSSQLHCQLLFFKSSFIILCSFTPVLLQPNAWLQFWSPIKSCFCNFRSRFYFCIFRHINLFTRVSCALFFLTRFKPPSLLSWLLLTSLPFSCLTLSGLVSFITGNIAAGSFFFHKPLLLLFSPFFCFWQHSLPNNSYSNFPTSYHYFYSHSLVCVTLHVIWVEPYFRLHNINALVCLECKDYLHAHTSKTSADGN